MPLEYPEIFTASMRFMIDPLRRSWTPTRVGVMLSFTDDPQLRLWSADRMVFRLLFG